jgi:putative nucleotidyltransferase with HDIG domain
MESNNIQRIIKKIDEVPTLPMVSTQIMAMLNNEDIQVKRLAALIERDQALAVKIIKIANSAFYGTLCKVSTIDHALMLLGTKEIKDILLAFSIHHFFSENLGKEFDRRTFWRHSVICSQISRYLGRHFKIKEDGTIFLTGLIHDIGKVIFDAYFHKEFLMIVHQVHSTHNSFSKAEKEILGITHYQIAAELLKKWNFPEKVIMNVFYHHAPWHDRSHTEGSIIVYLSNILTKIVGYPCLPAENKMDLHSFTESKAFDFIVQNGFELNHGILDRMVIRIEDMIASEDLDIFGS